MAAYAALLSLMHTVQHIKSHPRPPISLPKKQVRTLTKSLTFLQDFLECYSSSFSEEEEVLERRIAMVAYAAEDVIESHVVDQIHARSTSHGETISSVDLKQGLERVIEDMNLIKNEVMEIIKEKKIGAQHHQLMSLNSSVPTRPVSRDQNIMVEFDDILHQVLDKLTGQKSDLQIIPVVGMGGIGKTTLARNIYKNPLIVEHFYVLGWATISQEYNEHKILSQFYSEENKGFDNTGEDVDLGKRVYQTLFGRRYLIVLDDIWNIEAWDTVKSFFPDNDNGSRIMITTRRSNLAFELSGSLDFQMNLLNEGKSWNLLCEIVFGKEDCPIELEGIGVKIARNCRGLPLSIVVIGGLLTKSTMTREYWEHILENLNSIINLENNEQCLEILRTSYRELPVYLKPCFLYMGIFQEDEEIRVSELINLWVAEGILKPSDDKSSEEVANEYVKELIDRNLVLIHRLRGNGKAKSCKIHDLLRDLCLKEAQKQRFLCVLGSHDLNIPQDINMERHVCIHENTNEEYSPQFLHAVESMSLTRSMRLNVGGSNEPSPSLSFRLLRVYSRVDKIREYRKSLTSAEAIFQQANLRYISIASLYGSSTFPSSWPLFWNLQTLKIDIGYITKATIAPSEIWEMPLLRHVVVKHLQLQLPDPPSRKGGIVLKNLQTLSGIIDFKCSRKVVKRIPNITTLKFRNDTYRYTSMLFEKRLADLDLNYIVQLQKLECLHLHLRYPVFPPLRRNLVQNLNFPSLLKKLSLHSIQLSWEELTSKVGSLLHLEVLKLEEGSCTGPEWETVEGQFCSLRFLHIDSCRDLKKWKTDKTHFPRLEHLVLGYMDSLKEVPSCIGDIPTLQSIKLLFCMISAEDSVQRIKEEQEDYGNEDLHIECYNSE